MTRGVGSHVYNSPIKAGAVTKTNVIGIRKAINHVERLRAGWSGNRSNVTQEEADAIEEALRRWEPRVIGDLHVSGLKLLRSRRWRHRFTGAQQEIINHLDHFTLVRFDRIEDGIHTAVPVYRAVGRNGNSFFYRNIPWQSAYYLGRQSGPIVVGENRNATPASQT